MAVLKQLKIPPKGIRRARSGRAVPWAKIVEHYRTLIEKYHLPYEPMLNLVESLAASPVANELFPHTSMNTLLITDDEQAHHDDNVLIVSYDSKKREFEFEHRTLSHKNDKKICEESEAPQTLSLFLKYKFGVLFDSKRNN
jgi:hypothetical protein